MNAHAKIAATATLAQLKPGQDYPDGNINARLHYTDAEIDELAASLKGPDGQLRPFLVATHPRNAGVFFVFGGGRRRLAYERLIGRGELPKDHPIEIRDFGNISVSEALSKSLADNQAVPMHPADQAATFATLAADRSPEDIAKERGMTVRAVQQSIALGTALAPEVISAWREGRLSRDEVQVFTLAPDFEAQAQAIQEFRDSWQFKNGRGIDTRELRRKFMRNKEPEMKRLLGFVGVEAARAGGVEITEDFFGDGGVVKDMKPLKKLAKAKIDEIEAGLMSAGWAWVETRMAENFMNHGYGEMKVKPAYSDAESARLKEIKAKLNEIDKDLDGTFDYDTEDKLREEQSAIENAAAFRSFSDKQMAKGGVIVTVTKTGAITYEGGLIRKEEPKSSKQSGSTAPARPAPAPKIPDTNPHVEREIEEVKQAVLAELIAAKPREAFAMLLASVISGGGYGSGINWNDLDSFSSDLGTGRTFAAAFEQTRKLSIEKMAAKLAVVVGKVADISGFISGDKDALAVVEVVGEKNLQAGLAKRFDHKAYVAGASKQHLLGILAETRGAEIRKAHESDGEAKLALPVIEGIKATGWLPPALRTRVYAGPSAKKPAKAKKKGR